MSSIFSRFVLSGIPVTRRLSISRSRVCALSESSEFAVSRFPHLLSQALKLAAAKRYLRRNRIPLRIQWATKPESASSTEAGNSSCAPNYRGIRSWIAASVTLAARIGLVGRR